MMIRTEALTRHFPGKKGVVEAVKGIDLEIADGELVALLGPNGAGKSTTLRMLTTLLPPTSGSATVAGFDVATASDEVRRRIGYVGQGTGGGANQLVLDELICQGRCYGLDRAGSVRRAAELMDALDLAAIGDRKVSTLSGGQKRRLDIALGLVHRPGLLFLDEPSTGMDPQNRANLWEHILRLREQLGTTIVLTTHYLEEADSMAERVVVIDQGSIIADDTSAALKADLAGDLITVTLTRQDQLAAAAALPTWMAGQVQTAGNRLTIRTAEGDVALPRFLRHLDSNGIEVHSADLARPTLDDVFLNLTGRSLRETGVVAA